VWNLYSEAHCGEKGIDLTLGGWGKNQYILLFLGQNNMLKLCSIIIYNSPHLLGFSINQYSVPDLYKR